MRGTRGPAFRIGLSRLKKAGSRGVAAATLPDRGFFFAEKVNLRQALMLRIGNVRFFHDSDMLIEAGRPAAGSAINSENEHSARAGPVNKDVGCPGDNQLARSSNPARTARAWCIAKLRDGRFPHWKAVGSQSVQAIVERLFLAWAAFFKGDIKRPPTFCKRMASLQVRDA